MIDLEAPWVGKSKEEYFGRIEKPQYDEDFEYESKRDMELEELEE